MKKKKKLNKKKFLSRIILLFVIIVLIIILIKNLGKKEEQKWKTSIIVNEEDVTKSLLDEPYIDKDNTLYLSIEDVQKLLDKNIYYEEESNKIITTSGTKVAAIDVTNNELELNTAKLSLASGVLNYEKNFYLPISEMTNIYNIEVFVSENSAVIRVSIWGTYSSKNNKKSFSKREDKLFFKKYSKTWAFYRSCILKR